MQQISPGVVYVKKSKWNLLDNIIVYIMYSSSQNPVHPIEATSLEVGLKRKVLRKHRAAEGMATNMKPRMFQLRF